MITLEMMPPLMFGGLILAMRHLISGEDCAIAGEATAVAAAPAAETFKKSRRFIQASP